MSAISSIAQLEKKPDLTFSFPEEKETYLLFIKEKEMEIVGSSNSKVFKYPLKESDFYATSLTHTVGHVFYFAIGVRNSRGQYIYSFDAKSGGIESIAGPLKDPHFIATQLIELGTGCNEGDNSLKKFGGATITIYDLSKPKGGRARKHHLLTEHSPWTCSVDKNLEKIFIQNKNGDSFAISIFD